MEVIDEILLVDDLEVLLALDGVLRCFPSHIHEAHAVCGFHLWRTEQRIHKLVFEGCYRVPYTTHQHITLIARQDDAVTAEFK